MKLWVLGGKGLLGSALQKEEMSCIATGSEVDIGDFSALERFLEKHPDITHIVNCAALSVVDFCETHQEEAFRVNTIGPENIAKIAKKYRLPCIHISTDYVFPGSENHPLKETDTTGPVNYYGYTKLEAEKKVLAIDPSICVLRTSWIFGEGGKNFVAKLLHMLQTQEEVYLADDQWGRPTYAPDLSRAILQMFGYNGLYQFANQGITTKYLFGCAMHRMAQDLGFTLKVKKLIGVPNSFFPSSCKRPCYSAFDTSKIEEVLETPIRSWEEALKEFLCEKIS